MDIEDWYHLDYFDSTNCEKNYSLLDGLNVYLEILLKYDVPSSFFVLGEIAESTSSTLNEIVKGKHDIGSHGWNHVRPITISLSEFYSELERSKKTVEDLIGCSIEGYRAPCFSIDRQRLDLVQKAGFSYDSSRIDFSAHPLYETINMDGYELIMHNIYRYDDFFEFQASTISVYGKNMPISGGGYIRLLPWIISQRLIKTYISQGKLFVLYIHPFELSSKPNPCFPQNVTWGNRLRFRTGRSTVSGKLSKLIELLKKSGYKFMTFSSLRQKLLYSKTKYNA